MLDTPKTAETEGATAPGETAATPSAEPTTPPAEEAPSSASTEQGAATDPQFEPESAELEATITSQRETIIKLDERVAELEAENAQLRATLGEAPPAAEPVASAELDETPQTGMWECLNEARFCPLAAPDPRTPATLFEGPSQSVARSMSDPGVTCPECNGAKVIYRGPKTDAAVAA